MPKYASYRKISGPQGYLAKKTPFRGNSLRAYFDEEGNYKVQSYQTIIAIINSDGVGLINNHYYSVTTSKHQGYCRAWLPGGTMSFFNTEEENSLLLT